MRVLVTGGSGFLGGATVARLADAGHDVLAVARRPIAAPPGVESRRVDLTDHAALPALVDGCDAVVHAAGLAHVFDPRRADPSAFDAVNTAITGALAAASAAAGVRTFVLASSISVYGGGVSGTLVSESASCTPATPYARSKLAAERAAAEHAGAMQVVALRLATLYGEGDPGNVGRLVRAIARRRFLWLGDGSNRKSLLHRDDAARACVAAVESTASDGPAFAVYNVTAPAVTMRDVVAAISGALGRDVPSVRVPAGVARAMAAAVPGALGGRLRGAVGKWLADDAYDGSRFDRRFGMHDYVALRDGIARQVRAGAREHA